MASPDTGTDYRFFENRAALVLSGGGARAAYQVGVLQAIAEWLPPGAAVPFKVLRRDVRRRAQRRRTGRPRPAASVRPWPSSSACGPASTSSRSSAATPPAFCGPACTGPCSLAVRRLAGLAAAVPARHHARCGNCCSERSRSSASRRASPPGRVQALAVATTSYTSGQAVAFFEAVPVRPGVAASPPRRGAPTDRSRRADGELRHPVHLSRRRRSTATTTATAPCASSPR